MMKITSLALGAALSLAALPALAQSTAPGATPSPGTAANGQDMPSNSTSTNRGSSSTTITNDQAPPAGSGTRALRPGQNPDGTPREQTPGNGPELPGMNGGQGR